VDEPRFGRRKEQQLAEDGRDAREVREEGGAIGERRGRELLQLSERACIRKIRGGGVGRGASERHR
jgi:hypothetical protein